MRIDALAKAPCLFSVKTGHLQQRSPLRQQIIMRRKDVLTLYPKAVSSLFLLLIPFFLVAQPGLVVNEVSQGSTGGREFAELVVVGEPCSTVDLRGWIFDDNNGEFVDCFGPNNGALSGTGIASGHIRFSFDPIWEEVPVGTIIVVYAFDPGDPSAQAEIGGLAPDFTDVNCDFVRVVPINASNTFMEMDINSPSSPSGTPCPANRTCPNGTTGNPLYTPATYIPLDDQSFAFIGRLGLRNDGDAFQVRQPNGNFFHGLSYGTADGGCTTAPTLDGGPDGLHLPTSGGNITHQFLNTVNDDFRNVANYNSFTATGNQSAGLPNSCNNAAWIASLRRPPENVFSTPGGGCNPNLQDPTINLCVGEQATLNFPFNGDICTSDSYSWSFSGGGSILPLSGNNGTAYTFEATGPGMVTITVTATLDNALLYSQGGCSGPMFPSELEYNFPVVINPGPTATPTDLDACDNGTGQAIFNLTNLNNTVNGGTGLPVSWFMDSQGNFPINNPGSYLSGPAIVYAQVTDGPCLSSLVNVFLNILPAAPAQSAQVIGCDQGGGQGFFDLTSVENTVNLGTGNTVDWWIDPTATIPINTPDNYFGTAGVVFATVTNGSCPSQPVPVTLLLDPAPNPNNAFINVNPTTSCGPTTVTVTFVMPGLGIYEVALSYGNPTNGYTVYTSGGITTGSTATFPITETTEFILTTVGLEGNLNCQITFTSPVTITTTITEAPDLSLISNPDICDGQTIDLNDFVEDLNTTGIPITFHTGLPPTPGNEVGSMVMPGADITYYAYADGGTGCTDTQAIMVTVGTGGTPILGTTTVCNDDPLISLDPLLDPSYPNGTWSGTGVTGNMFDPTGLNGPIQITFTPSDCGQPAMTTIDVITPGMPMLGTTNLCETDGLFDLTTLQDPVYPTGTWSGPGVVGSDFDPTGQSGPVTLTFTPTGGCADPATTDITVDELQTPILSDAQICDTDELFDLTQLQDLNFPFGTWSGPGVVGSDFDPVGQPDTVVLTYTYQFPCVETVTAMVIQLPSGIPQLGTASLCESAPLLDLTTLEDPMVQGGTWTGPGVNGTDFDPAGQSSPVTLTFTPDNPCFDPANTDIEILTPPMISNLTILCDPTNTTYTVSFDVSGGDGGPYFVDGTDIGGTTFTSDPINSVDPYSFNLDDENNCGPVLAAGTFDCSCATDAGTIDNSAPLFLCVDEDFSVAGFFNNDENLDGDDLFEFILHDDPGPTLGNILATSPDGNFTFPAGITVGQSYYISPVAGSDDGSGNIDLADDCLSVAPGIEVIFYQLSVSVSGDQTICTGECIEWELEFGGIPDFTLTYDVVTNSNTVTETILTSDSSTTVTVCPSDYGVVSGDIELVLVDMQDGNCNVPVSGSTTVTLLMPSENDLLAPLCLGDSLEVNGTIYDVNNPSGTETITGGSFNGCDSIITVEVIFPISDTLLTDTLCFGDFLDINGTIYDANTPSGTEILTGASYAGCDSTINVVLNFYDEAVTDLQSTLCPGEQVVVNGTTYDENTPAGTEVILGGSFTGCDSTVHIDLSFFPVAESLIDDQLCTGGSIVVNGTTYDEATPFGTEIITNGSVNGCDSIIVVDLTFNSAISSLVDPQLCPGESVLVNGVTYDETIPTGQEIIIGGSYLGCDSIIDVSLSYFAPAEELLNPTLCFGEEITVNGTIYNATTPTGTEILTNAASTGCDSTVLIDLSFFTEALGTENDQLCPGESITVNGTTYDETTPTGTEVLLGGSFTGCDSTVTIDLSFFAAAEGLVDDQLCSGEFVLVNGTQYDEIMPTGTEVIPNGSFNGCDSTVMVDLSFITVAPGIVDNQLCPGESVVVNGTTYDETTPTGTETIVGGSFLGCDSTVTIDLSFFPESEGDFTDLLCAGGSIVINGTTYDGDNQSGTEIFPGAAYTGCDSTLNVSISFAPPAAGSLQEVLCEGESLLINGTLYDETNPTGTEFFPGASFLGCDSTLEVSVSFLPNASESINLVLLPGESITINGVVYDENNLSGTETLVGGATNGCDSTITVSLSFLTDQASVQAFPPTCFGGSNGSILIDSLPLAVAPYMISLDGQAFVDYDTLPVNLTGLSSGFYTLTVLDGNGDFFNYEATVPAGQFITLDAGDDVDLVLGESVTLDPQTSFFPSAWDWEPTFYLDCDTCANPTVETPLQTITYTVTAYDADSCSVVDEITVRVAKELNIFVPNVFSPDNNGLNDEFYLFAGPEVANIRILQIFDRWGDLVYQAQNFPPNDPAYGWDGTHLGKPMNPAVFVYYFEVEFIDGTREIIKGDVTLVK
jgi:gliding motility-associated-like protein